MEETLREAGIPEDLIALIMFYLSSSSMRVLRNESMTESFKPSRGIHQGDAISLYIFVLCIERLGHAISDLMDKDSWHPVQLMKRGLKLSHIFFVDDLVLFAEATA